MHKAGILESRNRPILPYIAAFFFVLTFAIKALTDGPYMRGEVSSAIAYTKYATAFVACFIGTVYMLKAGEKKFVSEFNALTLIALIFALVSFGMQLYSGKFSGSVYVELFKFYMPAALAYCMLNSLDDRILNRCMVLILVFSLIGYFIELRSLGSSALTIDFEDFNSDTESSGFAEIALMLVFYFAVTRSSNVFLIISSLFSLLAFKRLAMLVTLFVLCVRFLAPKVAERRISRKTLIVLKLLTIVFAVIWIWILLPSQERLFIDVFGKSPFSFTMGRSNSLRYLYLGGFHSYGYGSANETIYNLFGVPFEMDLAKIAIELSPAVAFIFVWLFWDLAGDNFWGLIIIGYYMLNMITSDSLNSNFSFTLAYIVIGVAGCFASGSRCISGPIPEVQSYFYEEKRNGD